MAFTSLAGHIGAHAVIDTPACKDHLRVISHRLGLMGKVIGVHANAVTTDETWPEGQEVPLGASGLQHGVSIDAHLIEDDCQLVDESDVQVTLRVLDHLGSLCHANAFGFVGAGGDNAGI